MRLDLQSCMTLDHMLHVAHIHVGDTVKYCAYKLLLRISRPSSPQASHHAQGGDIADLYNVAYIESHLK